MTLPTCRLLLAVGLLLTALLAGCSARQAESLTQQPTANCGGVWRKECWDLVARGMTPRQVERLLGKPDRVVQSGYNQSWYYQGNYRIWFDESGRVRSKSGST